MARILTDGEKQVTHTVRDEERVEEHFGDPDADREMVEPENGNVEDDRQYVEFEIDDE